MPIIIESYWKERIKVIKCNNETYGAVRILEILRSTEHELGLEYGGPSEATIGRLLKNEWAKLPQDQKDNYRDVYWPESMESGHLPWYMSGSALELLKLSRSEWISGRPERRRNESDEMVWQRPSVNDVKWFWRVSESLPGQTKSSEYDELNVKARWLVARFLQMRDFGSLDSGSSSTSEITRFLEETMIEGMDREALGALEEFIS